MSEENEFKRRVASFLGELTALSQKHKLSIGGCGCAGSPYVYDDDGRGRYTIDNPTRQDDGKLCCDNLGITEIALRDGEFDSSSM